MKKQLVKHMLHSTAALALCAVMLTGKPFSGSADNTDGNETDIIIQLPGEEEGGSGNEPGIMPMSDWPPYINIPGIILNDKT